MTMVALMSRPAPAAPTHRAETLLIDSILEGWAKWAHRGGIRLGTIPAAVLLRIPYTLDADFTIELSDDRFGHVDGSVARLPKPLRETVLVEYLDGGALVAKAMRMGLSRIAYRERLHAAQWTLYASLQRELDGWRA